VEKLKISELFVLHDSKNLKSLIFLKFVSVFFIAWSSSNFKDFLFLLVKNLELN